MIPNGEDVSGEKYRFITGHVSEEEVRCIPEEDRPLIRAAVILRTADVADCVF